MYLEDRVNSTPSTSTRLVGVILLDHVGQVEQEWTPQFVVHEDVQEEEDLNDGRDFDDSDVRIKVRLLDFVEHEEFQHFVQLGP